MVASPPNSHPPKRMTRAATRASASGSEYSANHSSAGSSRNPSFAEHEDPQEEKVFETSTRGRKRVAKSYKEDDSSGMDEDDDAPPAPRRSRRGGNHLNGFLVSDSEGNDDDIPEVRVTRNRAKSASVGPKTRGAKASKRRTRRSARQQKEDDGFFPDDDEDADGSFEEDPDVVLTSPSPEPEPQNDQDQDHDHDHDHENGSETRSGKYGLRKRNNNVNYVIPPPLEDIPFAPDGKGRERNKGKSRAAKWGVTGTELSRMLNLPLPGSDTDSDVPARTPRKPPFGGTGSIGGGMFANGSAAGVMPDYGGTPSNLGKVGEAALADADPLGVNPNVTFDSVGGLDDHITALKEMTLLPLLYPELFQRFGLTPPRGVLFHGPPGTGKTLLARALASSCRSGGRKISFFMRKGADVLSKWVGEAERQLRILFEEAKSCQPSIIFFDEIDGLAPVRSSRQDQIHASIVATLLALMDGMDNRGQVVVIGATNRPDAVDPALRRPGRFDREFYFPLPNLAARAKILNILTKDWAGWEGERGEKSRMGLAKLTKGYGGADLRALCTEAALNAVQRRYPQIYQSEERLLVKPDTVQVLPKDFLISIKKLVPSSARSSATVATPLPLQLAPLLDDALQRVKTVLDKIIPVPKKRSALEEAQYEDDPDDDNTLEKEEFLQSMETLRVYRPRLLLCGPQGMGQNYVGPAALHQLEGFHIQSLDLGSLLSDSSRSMEAAIVQLFVEAKRNQPSVIYIPSLTAWITAVSESARTTMQSMLDSLSPNDPVLLLAVADTPFSTLPHDLKAWFGLMQENRFSFLSPTDQQRSAFFQELIATARKPPTEFPDAVKRRKRVLEKLPIAPPVAPRAPTAAELAQQEQKDEQTLTMLKFRLGPILMELKKKFKRFSKPAVDEYGYEAFMGPIEPVPAPVSAPAPAPSQDPSVVPVTTTSIEPNGTVATLEPPLPVANGLVNGVDGAEMSEAVEPALPPPPPSRPKLFNMDLERMQKHLYRGKYLTLQEFLEDIGKIVHNANMYPGDSDRLVKAQMMLTTAQVLTNEFDAQFKLECERMAGRERKRREEYARLHPKRTEESAEPQQPNANTNEQPQVAAIRRSARHNGQEPELPITDPLRLERQLKRQRSSDPSTPQEEGAEDDGRAAKKARMSGDEDDDDRDPLNIVGPTSSQVRPTTVRFEEPVQGPPPSPTPLPEGSQQPIFSAPNTGVEVSSIQSVPMMVEPSQLPEQTPAAPEVSTVEVPGDAMEGVVESEPAPPRSPTPEPHPPLVVPDDALESLGELLVSLTKSFNIEQLEQLRATCLSCIWRRRSDWDRTGMISELSEIVRTFAQEARKVDDTDDD